MSNMDMAGGASATGSPGSDRDGQSSPKDMAIAAAQTVKQEVASFADSAKEKAASQVQQHKETASDALGDFANAIRHAGEELSQGDQGVAGRMVKHAADSLESLSRTVSQKRPEELLETVRRFGRENPAAFLAGSVLAGLALGRFLRASEQHGADSATNEMRPQDAGTSGAGGSGASPQLYGSERPPGGPPADLTAGSTSGAFSPSVSPEADGNAE